jgi:RNA polymerase sigma factor (sigma-70 family)
MDLSCRLDRQFPHLVEDTGRQEIFELAARRIASRERRLGPIVRLHAYAWVVLRSIAVSRCRLGSSRLARHTLGSDEAPSRLAQLPSASGTAEQIESAIYLDQLMRTLTPPEQLVCKLRMAGFSSKEIADRRRTSPGAIDVLFTRAKQKLRKRYDEPTSACIGIARATMADLKSKRSCTG